jgi:DNA polymerase III epsilon subunit-like protein
MKFLIFDTETTGLPINKKLEPNGSNVDNWPYIVQFSYAFYDNELKTTKLFDKIIKIPKNVTISEESTKIHTINREKCDKEGVELIEVLESFMIDFIQSDLVIAHNIEFDHKIVLTELIRLILITTEKTSEKLYNYYELFKNTKNLYCTMQESVNLCNIKAINKRNNKEYIKFPTLAELHNYFFGYKPNNLHNSLNDIVVCFRCFYILKFGKDICLENEKIREIINSLL